jgi:hypothetical protein
VTTPHARPGRRSSSPRVKREAAVTRKLEQLEVDQEARRRLAAKLAGGGFVFPEVGRTLADDLATEARERAYVIDELQIAGGNALLVAQYKVGKTTLLMNLLKALADQEPFLNRFDVAPLDGRVAYWNYELDADQFRRWMRDIDVHNTERVAEPLHLRGAHLPFWLPEYAERAIQWLRGAEVEFLIVDPIARAWSGLVNDENDNATVGAFTDSIDALKREADVPHLVISSHTGRERFTENEERSRGATRLEDWMDVGWYFTKDKQGRRALRAMGRDVDVEAQDITYDGSTRRLYATGQTREQRREQEGLQAVVDALALGGDGPTTTDLADGLTGTKAERGSLVKLAAREALIERRYQNGDLHDELQEPRRGVALRCYLTDNGRALHARRVERSEGDH